MNRFRLLPLMFALALIPLSAWSQSNSPQSPVEISGEPRHHPKFENEFVRIWDVTVPANDATLWHAHRNDNVVVVFGDVNLRIETVGRDPVETQWKFGEVKFAKATYVHRAMNLGTTSFHNLTIELLKAPGPIKDLPKEAGREPVLENERLRAFRITLEPGQSTPIHTHPVPGLSINLTPAKLEVTTKGKDKPDRLSLPLGESRWRAGTVTHSIKNVGKTRFEGVDIEFK
jgi:hypothetical protein